MSPRPVRAKSKSPDMISYSHADFHQSL